MRATTILTLAGAVALTLALAPAADAQNLCNLGPSDGHATIDPPLHGDAPADSRFFFTAECPDGNHVCSNGSLTAATCSGNLTAGHFVFCEGTCSGGTTGTVSCDAGVTELVSGDFNGVCAGPNCSGAGPTVAYVLVFDQATIENALADCPGDPAGSGQGLSDANFGGPILYNY